MNNKPLEDWKFLELYEVGKIVTGSTPSKTKSENYGNDIIWIKPPDLDKKKYVDNSNEKISINAKDLIRLVPKGAVLVSCIGTIGKVSIANCELCTNQQINSIIPKRDVIISEFLYFAIKKIRPFLEKQGSSAVVPLLNKSEFSKIKIPVPSLSIQQKIVSILEKIEKIKEMRKKADQLTNYFPNAVFSTMFDNKKFSTQKLDKLCSKISSGSTPLGGNENYFEKGEILFIRSQNVLMNKFSDHDNLYISKEIHEKMKRTVIKKYDVLLNITGASIGRTAIYLGEDNKANVNQHVCIIRIRDFEQLNPAYLNYYLSSDKTQGLIQSINAGGTREALNYSQIKNFIVPLPPISSQQKFASIIKEIQNVKEYQKQSKEHIDSLFNQYMQKAFKGELTC